MWHLLVFALIGLVAGALARAFYPGRQPEPFLGTIALTTIGAISAGALTGSSLSMNSEFPVSNYCFSLIGAVLVVVLWSGWAYARRWNELWSS